MAEVVRPDPTNIVESLGWLMDKMEELLRRQGEEVIGMAEANRMLGYGERKRINNRAPWRIPFYGLKGYDFPRSVWKTWHDEMSDAARRAEYDKIPYRERARAMGAA